MAKIFDLTSNASFIVYRIETLTKMKTSKKMIYNYIELDKKTGSFPSELEFVTSFYDEKTGSSGSLFKNTKLDNYILAYTGTNYYFDREKDLYADVVGVCLGQGEHYPPCYRFYKRMVKKYGENIILTGHSLGGNIAMRVALEYNVKETIVYNAAPLYLKDGVDIFMTPDMDEVLYYERLARYNRKVKKIAKKTLEFTGSVKRIVSESDIFTRISELLGIGCYLGDVYIIKDAGIHGIKGFLGDNQETMVALLENGDVNHKNIVAEYKEFSLEDIKLLGMLSKDILTSLSDQINSTLQSETVLNSLNKNSYSVTFNNFIQSVLDEIEKKKKSNAK